MVSSSSLLKKVKYGFLLGWGYVYLVMLTLYSVLWYPSRIYQPPIGYYSYYPLAIQTGALTVIWLYNVQWMAMISGVFSFFGFLLAIFALVPVYGQQGKDFNQCAFNGQWNYPTSTNGILNITVVNQTEITGTYIGFAVFGEVIQWVNIAFYFAGMVVAFLTVVAPSSLKQQIVDNEDSSSSDEEEEDIGKGKLLEEEGGGGGEEEITPVTASQTSYFLYREGTSRIRLSITWLCLIFSIGCSGAHSIVAFLQYANSVLPFSLFTNQFTLGYLLLVIGIFPPGYHNYKAETRDLAYDRVPFWAYIWLVLLLLSICITLWTLIETGIWRSMNGMNLYCPGGEKFGEGLMYFTSSNDNPLPEYSLQVVYYDNVYGKDRSSELLIPPYTCFDDWMSFILLIIQILVWILGILMYCYPENVKDREQLKLIERKRGRALNDAIKEESSHSSWFGGGHAKQNGFVKKVQRGGFHL